MKKPIDSYLLGAYEYLVNQQPGKQPMKRGKKDDILEELRSDVVDVMCGALSHGGQLIIRDDQRLLQAVYVGALKSFTKNKKKSEMLDAAIAKFGANPQVPKDSSEAPTKPLAPTPANVHEGSDVTGSVQRQIPIAPAPVFTKRVVGISRNATPSAQILRKYTPIRSDALPDITIFGGLLSLTTKADSLLGPASIHAVLSAAEPTLEFPVGATLDPGSVGGFSIFGPIDGASSGPQPAYGVSDKHLFEGVLHAWGQ
jgi:hypothetical protein